MAIFLLCTNLDIMVKTVIISRAGRKLRLFCKWRGANFFNVYFFLSIKKFNLQMCSNAGQQKGLCREICGGVKYRLLSGRRSGRPSLGSQSNYLKLKMLLVDDNLSKDDVSPALLITYSYASQQCDRTTINIYTGNGRQKANPS